MTTKLDVRCNLADFGFANPRGMQPRSDCASLAADHLPLAAQLLRIDFRVENGGCTVVPDVFGRAAASGQWHRVWRPPSQLVVPSHPTVLRTHQQYRRLVEAVASSPRHPDSKRREELLLQLMCIKPGTSTQQGTPIPSYET